jgi:serine/tyrosine/threonine adenylyltransferase
MATFFSLPYHQRFTDSLPGDHSRDRSPRQVDGSCFSLTDPTPVAAPELIGWSSDVAQKFNLEKPTSTSSDLAILAGNRVCKGMVPYAACYGGNQFGNWAGQLGDGRALSLGEVEATDGSFWEFQLKGAGPTPYSRGSDGRAVLRSSIREFLASEALYWLGIPTTRALSVVKSGDGVVRDIMYDGNPEVEPGALVMRVAPSFLRFGSYEIFASRNDISTLTTLTEWTVENFFPHLLPFSQSAVEEMFKEIATRTIETIIEWYRVGFVHGVMNTDNMSILGLTLDYGPYGFLDSYDPHWTPNTTDLPRRRYCYARQGSIALWNLGCLASALTPLCSSQEVFIKILENMSHDMQILYRNMLAKKLGLKSYDQKRDSDLIEDLFSLMSITEVDMTIFFRRLSTSDVFSESNKIVSASLKEAFYAEMLDSSTEAALDAWIDKYRTRISENSSDSNERIASMCKVNPHYILRNYMAVEVIDAAHAGDYSLFEELQSVLRSPYDVKVGSERWEKKRPEWAKTRVGCSLLSCSS